VKYLITGGFGFLGTNIANEILRNKDELIIFDNLYRSGSTINKEWLESKGKYIFIHGDIRNPHDVERTIIEYRPDIIFHLAGQVAMTTSIVNPRMDFEINAIGSFNVLEAVRQYSPDTGVLYSSTNKVYGDLAQYNYRETSTRFVCEELPNGFDESVPLDFHSPYGTSKGSADQYMLDYARIFGINTVVFRHSSMYGGRQFATYDQGWVGWFVKKAIEIRNGALEPFTISGNGKQVRDLLYSSDCVDLYLKASRDIDRIKGQVFNIGGGMQNSFSLLELFKFLEEEFGISMKYTKLPPRESDQKVFVADFSKIKAMLGWQPKVSKEEGIKKMIEWVLKN
jgi:CDP-paratose 2-epimerase